MKVIPFRPDLKQEYKNPFKEKGFYPFTEITRVLADSDTGEILTELNELDSRFTKEGVLYNLDELKHGIFLKIPPFYCKRNWKGEVLEDSFIAEVPPQTVSEIPSWITNLKFEVWPSFVRPDGSIRPYILYGCFKGSEINGKLMSLPYKQPVVSKTITQMRALARTGRTEKFNIETFGTVAMMQFLYKIAFQDLNSQAVIGNGWTNKSAANKTGSTMALGNRTGFGTTDWGIADGYDAPDPRICFIMGVQDGKFKYWSKDPNIKPEGIDSAINQFDNGVVTSETGEFACKVNKNSIYIGRNLENKFDGFSDNEAQPGFLDIKEINNKYYIKVKNNFTSNSYEFTGNATSRLTQLNFENKLYASIFVENGTTENLINNRKLNLKMVIRLKTKTEPFVTSAIYFSDVLKFGNNILEGTIPSDKEFLDAYIKIGTNYGNDTYPSFSKDDVLILSKCTFSNEKFLKDNYINKNLLGCKITLNCNFTVKTNSFIYKNVSKGLHDSSVLSTYYLDNKQIGTDEAISLKDNEFYNCILSKNFSGVLKSDGTFLSKLATNNAGTNGVLNENTNKIVFGKRQSYTSNSLSYYIIYEGNLTEQELRAELSKNLKIPDSQCTQQLPNYKGEDQGYYGKYNNTNTDFPLVKPAIYRIKDSNGLLYLAKIENDDAVKGDKIQILSGKVRVKEISPPFELSIIPSFPFETANGYQAPDKSCVGAIMADSTGLKSWFSEPGTKIKGIENARIVEETEDYMIICDGTTVTIDNYVVGTYDLYNETLANVEKTKSYAGIPLVIGATEPTIDHEALLNKINKEQLAKLLTKPTVSQPQPTSFLVTEKHNYLFKENWKHIKINEVIQIHYEDNGIPIEEYELTTPNTDLIRIDGHRVIGLKAGTAVISTEVASFCLIIDPEVYVNPKPEPEPTPVPVPMPKFPARTIPIPVDLCCRIDKKTGEIGISEGYENLAHLTTSNGQWDTYGTWTKIDNEEKKCSVDYSTGVNKSWFCFCPANFSLIANQKYFISTIVNKRAEYLANKKLHQSIEDGTDSSKEKFINENNYQYYCNFMSKNNYSLTVIPKFNDKIDKFDYKNIILVAKNGYFQFVKNQMPNGKITILTKATSLTHSFLMNHVNVEHTANNASPIIFGTPNNDQERYEGYDKNKINSFLISKTYKKTIYKDNTSFNLITRGENIFSDSFLNIGNSIVFGIWRGVNTFKNFFIYKNNLLEDNLKIENNKNFKLNNLLEYRINSSQKISNSLICNLEFKKENIINNKILDKKNNKEYNLYNFNFNDKSIWTKNGLLFNGKNNYVLLNRILENINDFTIEILFEDLLNNNNILSGGSSARNTLFISKSSIKYLPSSGTVENRLEKYPNTKIILIRKNNKFSFYLDGEKQYNESLIDFDGTFNYNFTLMTSALHTGEKPELFLNGILKEFRLYNKALTENEIFINDFYDKLNNLY